MYDQNVMIGTQGAADRQLKPYDALQASIFPILRAVRVITPSVLRRALHGCPIVIALATGGQPAARAATDVPVACPGLSAVAASAGKISIDYGGPYANGRAWDLRRDGNTWIPKGVNIGGLAEPFPGSQVFSGYYSTAMQFAASALGSAGNWGCTEMQAARDFGADSLRFFVSQDTLAATSVAQDYIKFPKNMPDTSATIADLVALYGYIYPSQKSAIGSTQNADPSAWSIYLEQYYAEAKAYAGEDLPYFMAFLDIINTYFPLPSLSTNPSSRQIAITVRTQFMNLQHLIGYAQHVVSVIDLARHHFGFTVIIVPCQGGRPANDNSTTPSSNTLAAWGVIGPPFVHDLGVMFEVYNEPVYDYGSEWTSSSEPLIWSLWQSGNNAGIVSHQRLVDLLRITLGSRNVIIVDGVQAAAWVSTYPGDPLNSSGMPLNYIRDDLHEIAYAVHPYPAVGGNNDTLWRWQHNFGYFAQANPVIATEWNTSSLISCRPFSAEGESPQADGSDLADSPLIAYDFLTYAQSVNIGVFGWAFDYPNQLLADPRFNISSYGYSPTNYSHFQCDPVASGKVISNSFSGGGGADLQALWNGTLQRPLLSDNP